MLDYSGDDLLKIFKDLDIKLFNLNPNVVKAWFDTDDSNTKNLLNWMCVSLSRNNYVSPLEIAEYNRIDLPLTYEELEVEKQILDKKYPGIFDLEYNLLEIEFLEEDLNLARQQDQELNQTIDVNSNWEEKLSKQLTQKLKDEIQSSVKLKITQKKCVSESQKLDELNNKIFNKLLNSTKILLSYEFSLSPCFINNFDIDLYREKISFLWSTLNPLLEVSDSRDITALSNVTNLDSIHVEDSISNDLYNMHHRILHSQHRYLATALEVVKVESILKYLNKTTTKSLLPCDVSQLNQNIAVKLETKKRICDMLENATKKFAERQIAQPQQRYIQQEFEMYQTKLHELQQLEECIQNLLAHYLVLSLMYEQERKDAGDFESFYKKTMGYVNRDLERSAIRTENMKRIIQLYHDGSSDERLKLTKTIVKILSGNEQNFTIDRAYKLICDFNAEVDFLEENLFKPGFDDVVTYGKDLNDSIKALQSFLVSGPTHRVLLVPCKLDLLIRQVEDLLKKQLTSVKSAMKIVASAKKIPTKWQNYRRQLWMYFYVDPSRIMYILQEIESEFKMTQENKLFNG